MVLIIKTVEQALCLGLISQTTVDKYGKDKVQAYLNADADQYLESQTVAENENDFTLDDDDDGYSNILEKYILE
jgi:hypothetical protein